MITSEDVKLLKSERLTDEDDGGGRATGNAVVDGEVNNLFPDISRLDRTTGRISLRKVFAGVLTDNNDPYLGVHSIVTKSPSDPRVSTLLFNTGSQTDTRLDARNMVESYMAPASTATFELLGNQLQGQRAIVGIQREDQSLPEVGEVYQLVSSTGDNQFIRITSFETSIETFTYVYNGGTSNWVTFTRRRLVLGISSPLSYTFPGGEPTPAGTSRTSPTTGELKTVVLSTQVADAARYYGISTVADDAAEGDLNIKVESVYSQLVPSTSRENPLTNLVAGYDRIAMIPSGPQLSRTMSGSASNGTSTTFYFGSGIAPGTLTLSVGGSVYRDDSSGRMVLVSGIARPTMDSAILNYDEGSITVVTWWNGGYSWQATFTPATRVLGETITDGIDIDLGSRGYIYTLNLSEALPRPGTLVVSYMALGKWYDLRDRGNGELQGEGSGTVDFASGAVSITLNALPDVDSALMYSYISSSDDATTQIAGAVTSDSIRITRTLGEGAVKPGSLSISWRQGNQTKTATDDGNGALTGDAAGSVSYASGEVDLSLSVTPDSGTVITYTYEEGSNLQEVKTSVSKDSAGMATFTIAGAPLKPGSVELQFMVSRKNTIPTNIKGTSPSSYSYTQNVMMTVNDDGNGGWVGRAGTIDYSTGQCWVQVEQEYTYPVYNYYQKIRFVAAGA